MIRNDPKTTLNAFLRVKTILLRQFQQSKIFRKFAYENVFCQNHDFLFFIQCINTIKKVNRKEIEEPISCVIK